MNKSIKAIIFDVGGVLVRTFDQSGRQEWETRLGLPPGGAEAVVLNSEMGHKAQRGEISSEELWKWVGEYLDIGEDLIAFRTDFWRGDFVDEALVELIRQLRGHYVLAIISNATDALLDTLQDYGLAAEFDLIIGSAYEEIMKPDPRIYEIAINRLGLEPAEAVFIDDSLVNVAGAQAVGLNAIHFNSQLDLEKELAELGVNPLG